MTMGFYVASRSSKAPLWLEMRERGLPIISSWIDEAGEGDTADFGELWARIEGEIRDCDALIFYAEDESDFPFKGALVEVGMALAFGKRVFASVGSTPLSGRTLRPVGSWVRHPRVTLWPTLGIAVQAALEGVRRNA